MLEATHEELRSAGATSARVFADPSTVEWAARWGYRQTRQVHYAGIDPRKAPDIPGIPSGVELVPLNEVDPRSLYEADLVAQRTKPGDAKITTRPYDDWLAGVWKSPAMVLDLSMAAVYEDRVIGFTLGNGDHTKIWSQMTATMPVPRSRPGQAGQVCRAAPGRRGGGAGRLHRQLRRQHPDDRGQRMARLLPRRHPRRPDLPALETSSTTVSATQAGFVEFSSSITQFSDTWTPAGVGGVGDRGAGPDPGADRDRGGKRTLFTP